jgi:hypothetical protein
MRVDADSARVAVGLEVLADDRRLLAGVADVERCVSVLGAEEAVAVASAATNRSASLRRIGPASR